MAATLLIGALKVVCLMVLTAALATILRPFAARARAVVWQTALAGALVIPFAAPLLPPVALPIPWKLDGTPAADSAVVGSTPHVHSRTTEARAALEATTTTSKQIRYDIDWTTVAVGVWITIGSVILFPFLLGMCRVRGVLRRAKPITADWQDTIDHCRLMSKCRRRVSVLASDDIQAPATVGIVRPTIVVPKASESWTSDRRQAVLLHELIHIARFDWPMRVVGRIARAVYWFNPLTWWAVRRLDLEQEKACDEEVVALGTPSTAYAEHLLAIARIVNSSQRPALSGLTMAHKTHLEERIMSIIGSKRRLRGPFSTVLPAFILTAAMVPALAAVYPTDPPPRSASSELRQALDEMKALEIAHEPQLERIHEVERLMESEIEMIHDIEIDIDHEAIAEVEARMQPYLEQIEEIEIDMRPIHEQLEVLQEKLGSMVIHVEDGTFDEIHIQLDEQMREQLAEIEGLHLNLEPHLEMINSVHIDMEHLHEDMEQIHIKMEPKHEELQKLHESLEPYHDQIEAIHEEMAPIHEKMEEIGERIEKAIVTDVAAVLRSHLDTVTSLEAPINEAAARLIEIGTLHIEDDLVELTTSRREAHSILTDLLAPHRVGMQDAFDEAVDRAADEVSDLRIEAK